MVGREISWRCCETLDLAIPTEGIIKAAKLKTPPKALIAYETPDMLVLSAAPSVRSEKAGVYPATLIAAEAISGPKIAPITAIVAPSNANTVSK